MYKNVLEFYSGDANLSVHYVKNILPLMGNIKEFEVFKDEDTSPYRSSDNNHGYTFILKDDKNNQLWLSDCTCGTKGAEATATINILKLFGLLQDYKITENDYVNELNLIPIHRLNIMISTPNNENKNNTHHFWLLGAFKYPYQLLNAKKTLSYFGLCTSDKQEGITIPPSIKKYEPKEELKADKKNKKVKKHDEFSINNEFIFNMDYKDCDVEFLKKIVLDIFQRNGGEIEIIDI